MLSSGRRNNNSPTARINQSRSSSSSSSALNSKEWKYRGGNKQQWSKLCISIKQKLNAENIGYIENPEEMARRKEPPPPSFYFPPPGFFPETDNEKEIRKRTQDEYDEDRKTKTKEWKRFKDLFAADFPTGTSACYSLLSQ
jgi:hypothetical protein